jgi:hypothetical protein
MSRRKTAARFFVCLNSLRGAAQNTVARVVSRQSLRLNRAFTCVLTEGLFSRHLISAYTLAHAEGFFITLHKKRSA